MNKKNHSICKVAAITLATALTLPGLAGMMANADTAAPIPYNVNFSLGTTASQVRFNWLTTSGNAPEVQIAKTSDMQGNAFPSGSTVYGSISPVTATVSVEDNPGNANTATGEYQNKATVNGLALSTKYTYRVGDGTNWSGDYTFTTGNPSKGFSFAAFGDPQIGAGTQATDQSGWANTLKTVTNKYPALNFLFSLGDEVNDYDSLATQQSQYQSFFNPDTNNNFLQDFPLVAFEGNHDHQMGTYYSFHYNHPNQSTLGQTQDSGVSNNDGDYWFTYGNTLFMVLNGNDPYDTAAHDEFMQQAVSANPGVKWKVAAWHQSAYSEANHAASNSSDDPILFIRQNWPKLMDKYGVDVVLQGHDHEYTRTYQMYGGVPVSTQKQSSVTNPKGTVYFTLDSGSGSKYYQFNASSDHTFSEVFWQQNEPTYSYITMNDNQFSINTFRTDTGASIDSYSITKTAASTGSSSSTASQPATVSSSSTSASSGTTSTASSQVTNPKTGDSSSVTPAAIASACGVIALLAMAAYTILSKRKKAGSTK